MQAAAQWKLWGAIVEMTGYLANIAPKELTATCSATRSASRYRGRRGGSAAFRWYARIVTR
jgi:hypothetical protein